MWCKKKNKLLNLQTSNSIEKNIMSNRISTGTVKSANKRLIKEGRYILSSSNISVSRGSMNVSVRFRGQVISQSITPETLKTNYGKSLNSISNASKL